MSFFIFFVLVTYTSLLVRVSPSFHNRVPNMCLYISGSSNSTSVKHLIHNYRGDGNIDLQNIIADGSSSPFVIPVCVCELLNSVQLSVTPCTVARQASLSVEFSRQEYWSGLPCPSKWDLPNPGIKPRSFYRRATREALLSFYIHPNSRNSRVI